MISCHLLREERIAAELTQEQLAERIGISPRKMQRSDAHEAALNAEEFFNGMKACGATIEIKRGPRK